MYPDLKSRGRNLIECKITKPSQMKKKKHYIKNQHNNKTKQMKYKNYEQRCGLRKKYKLIN